MDATESICPGCGLAMPRHAEAVYGGDFNASPECWEVFTEVIGKEFSNVLLFGQVHQLTVDAYAAQHTGGNHRDKSVMVHLSGLYLAFEHGLRSTAVTPLLQQLANVVRVWPHLPPPGDRSALTIFDVALAESIENHSKVARAWAKSVWQTWSPHHQEISDFVVGYLDLKEQKGKQIPTA
ncbi:MAG: DUF5946 family protein [Verrucomicrobiota bacterium]